MNTHGQRNVLLTMSGADYESTTERLVVDGPKFGADVVLVYDDTSPILQEFKSMPGNRWLWDHPVKRCWGYCAWKARIILDALDRCDDGSVVFYVDADCQPVSSLKPIFDIARRDGACFFASCGHKQHQWCKRECYQAMGQPGIDRELQAGCARFAAFRKGGWTQQQLLFEWLTYSVNRFANTKDTMPPAQEGFIEHRDEQAIMTNLVHKYGYKLHRECDQTGEDPAFYDMDRELYPQLFEMIHQTKGTNGKGSRWRNV